MNNPGVFAGVTALATGGLAASQISLLNYVDVWSRIPLSVVEADPFDTEQLTPAMREGLQPTPDYPQGVILPSSIPLLAAQCYVTRAKSYEQGLLESLGLPSRNVAAFADERHEFGDHFQAHRYPWQENERAAGVAIAELTGLHETLTKALIEVRGWKKSIGYFPDGTDYVDVRDFLQDSLTSLQELLVERASHARHVRETYDINMEAGLAAYFYRYRRRHSGVQLRLVAAGIRVSDSTPPPAQAAG
jgi:hypothetical protein